MPDKHTESNEIKITGIKENCQVIKQAILAMVDNEMIRPLEDQTSEKRATRSTIEVRIFLFQPRFWAKNRLWSIEPAKAIGSIILPLFGMFEFI